MVKKNSRFWNSWKIEQPHSKKKKEKIQKNHSNAL